MKVSLRYQLKPYWILPLLLVSNIASNEISTTTIKIKLHRNLSLGTDEEKYTKSFVSGIGVVSRDIAKLRVT